MMRVTVIRHGRTKGNTERRYIGCKTDEPLSPEGRSALAEITCGKVRLFVSPMARARETAEILFPAAEQIVIEEFRETDFGMLEGKNHAELDGDPDYQAWIDSGGTMQIPGGESMDSFRSRSMDGLRKAVKTAAVCRGSMDNDDFTGGSEDTSDFTEGDSGIYIVAHGGTVMAVMSALTGEEYYDFYSDNGCGYTIDLEVDDAGNIISAGTYDRFCCGVRAGSYNR